MTETLSALTPVPAGAGVNAGGDERAALARAARARAREALARADNLLRAVDPLWSPPPYDPLLVAQALGIRCVRMSAGASQPALLCTRDGTPTILYRDTHCERTRFNLFHEIAHTLFPDFHGNSVLSRQRPRLFEPDGRLEKLCDAAAFEFMMPADLIECDLVENGFGADRLPELCRRFGVWPEAVSLRMVETDLECCAVARFEYEAGPRRRQLPGQIEPSLAMPYFIASSSFQKRRLALSRRFDLDRDNPIRITSRSKKPATSMQLLRLLGDDARHFLVQAFPLTGRRRHGYSPVMAFFYPR